MEKRELKQRKVASLISNSSDEIPQGEVHENKVRRGLKQRQISMIALGGTIGTGLFIGTGSAIQNAGPAGALIGYIFMASVVYSLALSVGEMAAYIPITGSFSVFCTRFVSPAFGASIGWMYWFCWAIAGAVELSIVGRVIEFWTHAVPNAAWIAISFVLLTTLNFFPVKVYGELEFWSASIKIVAAVGWLIYALCMVCGVNNDRGAVGFRYWHNPGPWGPGILVQNMNTARFLGWLSALINAAFTYEGTELVGVTAGESANPRKAVPRAINRVFFRILIFYIGSIFFMGLLVPYDDPALNSTASYISSSPFVIAILNSGTPILAHIFNAVILTTILSTGNANIYVGSRLLYALGSSGTAPKIFTRTSSFGVPYVGVIFTSLFGLLGFLSVSSSAMVVFEWLVNLSTVAGLLAWIGISVSHLRFMDALEYHGLDRNDLPYKAKGGRVYVWYALVCLIFITIVQGFTSFWEFTASKFLTAYISLFIWIFLWLFFQFVFYRGELYKPVQDIDIFSDSTGPGIDLEEEKEMTKWEKFVDVLF